MKISIDGFAELEKEVGREEAIRQAQDALRAAADVVGRWDRLGRRVVVTIDQETGREILQIATAEPDDQT
jgi:hypothetical protein